MNLLSSSLSYSNILKNTSPKPQILKVTFKGQSTKDAVTRGKLEEFLV